MRWIVASTVLLAGMVACAQDPPAIVFPTDLKGDVAKPIILKATTKGEMVQWVTFDPALCFVPGDLLVDKKTTVLIGAKPGRYTVYAYTCVDGKLTELFPCVVVVGNVQPVPPQPNPNPDDISPDDPFLARLQNAYPKLTALPTRKALKSTLADVYRTAALGILTKDSRYSAKQVLDALQTIFNGLDFPADALVEIRKVIAAELAAHLPTNQTHIFSEEEIKNAKALFIRVAKTLDAVKEVP